MLREVLGRRAGAGEDAAGAGAGAGARAGRVAAVLRGWLAGFAGLAGRHRLFSVVAGVSVVPRVVTMAGFRPAILFKLDSYDYLWGAEHLRPNPVNPSGYSVFLWLLRPFHSLALVAALQHLAGLAVAVMVYAVLRRFGVRGWIATAAAAPVLFDPAQFLMEQLIMADLLAFALMLASFAVLLWRQRPGAARAAAAGLLMGASAVVRPTTLPLIVFLAVFLLARRAGWRAAGAVALAGAAPVLAYMAWFAAASGSFNLTNSNGLFLWSRTMSFADCAVIRPPAGLAALCPDRQPRQQARGPGAARLLPKVYLWDHHAWMWTSGAAPAGPIVPDTAAFTTANNQRALRFAIAAIKAQPLGYATAVAKDAARPFVFSDTFPFPGPAQPTIATLGRANRAYALASVRGYLGTTAGIGPYLGHRLGARLVQPWARLIRGYQHLIFLPGPLFALIVAAGLGGILIPRRRVPAAVLLWTSAVTVVVLPIAEHEYTYRYVIPAVPLACMAAALAFARRPASSAHGAGAPDPPADALKPATADTTD
jgi:hypothetical protein